MLIRLQKNLSQGELASLFELCAELGCRAALLGDSGILSVEGPGGPELRSRLEDHYGVDAVIDAGEARELALRGPRTADRAVRVRDAVFGGGWIAIAAGPCAVESGERLVEIARGVRRRGATLLRGGAFKPRTSPYSFQGSGHEGLRRSPRARAETGLGGRHRGARSARRRGRRRGGRHVPDRLAQHGQHAALAEVGRTRKPVLLKRGFAATLREFLLAAEFVLARRQRGRSCCASAGSAASTRARATCSTSAAGRALEARDAPAGDRRSVARGRTRRPGPPARARGARGRRRRADRRGAHEPGEAHSDGEQAIDLAELRRDRRRRGAIARWPSSTAGASASAAITPAGARRVSARPYLAGNWKMNLDRRRRARAGRGAARRLDAGRRRPTRGGRLPALRLPRRDRARAGRDRRSRSARRTACDEPSGRLHRRGQRADAASTSAPSS